MPAQIQPRYGFASKWLLGESGWKPGMDQNMCMIDQLIHPCVSGQGVVPTALAVGEQWIDPAGNLLTMTTAIQSLTPRCGMSLYDSSANEFYFYDGTSWLSLTQNIANSITLTAPQILAAIQLNPAAVYAFGSGAAAPAGAPASPSFPFYLETTNNVLYGYDYATAQWVATGTDHSVTSQAGVSPLGDAAGKIDISWLDPAAIATAGGSVTGGTAAQSGIAVLGDGTGKIDPSWLDPAALGSITGGTVAQSGLSPVGDATGRIDGSWIDPADVNAAVTDVRIKDGFNAACPGSAALPNLGWDAVAGSWVATAGAAVALDFDDLGDVNVPAPVDKVMPIYDGVAGEYVPIDSIDARVGVADADKVVRTNVDGFVDDTLIENDRFVFKTLQANVQFGVNPAQPEIADLRVTGLTLGKSYEVQLVLNIVNNGPAEDSDFYAVDVVNGTAPAAGASPNHITAIDFQPSGDTNNWDITLHAAAKFVAISTELRVFLFGSAATPPDVFIIGNGGTTQTHITVTEHNNLEQELTGNF